MRKFRYAYEPDGLDEEGIKIPDVPVIYLVLQTNRGKARGPAVLDTGFDGGIYPNIQVVHILEGMKPLVLKRLEHPIYGYVECEIYKAKAFLSTPNFTQTISIGEVKVYVPTEPEYLTDEVLVGREILNNLKIELDGQYVTIKL